MTHSSLRRLLVGVWLVVVCVALYLFFFHRDLLEDDLQAAVSWSAFAGSVLYLFFGCVRGFTLIPSTTLLVAAVPFFPPARLFLLTLAGILVSSAAIYRFSEALHLEEVFARTQRKRIDQLTHALQRYELPVIIGWSFFPLAPTDLIVYVCGMLRINFAKCLLGVGIGEGCVCALYIFAGDYALRSLGFR